METTRFLLVISLGLVLTMIWQAWMEDYGSLGTHKNINKPHPDLNEQYDKAFPGEAETNAPALSVEQSISPRKTHDIETTAAEKIKVTTDVFDLVINLRGGTIEYASLKKYPVSKKDIDKKIVLLKRQEQNDFYLKNLIHENYNPPQKLLLYLSLLKEDFLILNHYFFQF